MAGTRGRQLVGWDAKGNILVREGNTIFTAIGQGAPRPLPDDLQTDRKVSFTFTTSPDRTVNVIGSTRDQGRSIYVSLAKIIDGYSPNAWVGAHQALVTHNGKHFVFDGATGDEQPVDLPERARVLAATERDIVWAEGDELHVTSTKGGQDRQIVGAQAREVNVTTLATDGLLIYSTLNKKAWLVDLQPR